MKKLSIIITGLALFLGTTAFAGEGDKKSKTYGGSSPNKNSTTSAVTVNKEITGAFSSRFKGAENVNWKQESEFYFADFQLNKKIMSAAYGVDGELLGVSRNLELSQLPLHVEMSIRDKYKDYRVASLITEIVHEGETTYYFNAENSARTLKLKCNSYGQVEVLKRTKKKLVGSVY